MRPLPLLLPALAAGAVLAAPPAKKPGKPAAGKPGDAKPSLQQMRRNPIPALGARGGAPAVRMKESPAAPRQEPAPSQLPQAPPPPPTVFQTNSEYDPRLDLKTDLVTVHRHGAPPEEVEKVIRSWKVQGYPVHRMFFIGSDAGGIYTGGKVDGSPHPDDVEMDAEGRPLKLGQRPFMVPTEGWLSYLKQQIRVSIDAGADGIWPEEPLLHAAGGYSPAFKAAWQEAHGTPWQAPHASPETFWKGSRLKADLYLRAVDELLRFTREYGKQKGRDVRFFLPVHSAVSYASWNLVFPHAAASRLPVDGLVAQVWTGPARTPVTYEGRAETRVFENSWMLYSYFANLMDGVTDRSLYFLADPAEDDPGFSWSQYEERYRSVVAASLFFPQARGYQVMPWPERVYLPGSATGGGTPAPAPYLTTLGNVTAALKELPSAGPLEWTGGTRGIGVIALDTMMWQRGGPQGSSMRSLHGLVMPLLSQGVPVEIVPGERAGDRAYLSRFKVLLLSYDMQKPLGPELNQALADWARAGGSLVVLGGEDAYNRVGEWWTRSGYDGPTDHLFRLCGAGVQPLRQVRPAAAGLREVLKAEGRPRKAENRQVYRLPVGGLASGKPVLVRFTDLHPEDGWGPRLDRVRLVEGGRVRTEFVPGTAAERPFLAEDQGSSVGTGFRFADADAAFIYRFNRLGPDAVLELDLSNQFLVSAGPEPDGSADLQPALPTLPTLRAPASHPLVSYTPNGAEPLYRTAGSEAVPAWACAVGAGRLFYCGTPAAIGADTTAGAGLVRALTRLACDAARVPYAEGPMVARRGPYVVAHSLGRTVNLPGEYLDLFDPALPVVRDPQLPQRAPGLYKAVSFTGRVPALLHASHRARLLETTARATRVLLDGPQGTRGALRLFRAGMSLAGVEALDSLGRRVDVESEIDRHTLLVRYPQQSGGVNLVVRWIRPEARLTK